MARKTSKASGDSDSWQPGPHALHLHSWADPDDAVPEIFLLSHPAAPFTAPVSKQPQEEQLQKIAYRYLVAVRDQLRDRLKIPKHWLDELEHKSDLFAWMPIHAPRQRGDDPLRSSFWVERSAGANRLDRTLVLMASEGSEDKGFLGSGFGMRVLMHLVRPNKRDYAIQITGMSASLPFGDFRKKGLSVNRDIIDQLGAIVESLDPVWEKVLRMAEAPPLDRIGLRIAKLEPNYQIEVRGTGFSGSTPVRRIVNLRMVPDETANLPYRAELISSTEIPLVTDAARGTARVFDQVPPSSEVNVPAQMGPDQYHRRRVTRKEKLLDRFRREKRIGGTSPCVLADDYVEVRESRFVYTDLPAQGIKKVALPGNKFPPVRSNDFSAVSAYDTCGEFFSRMEDFGIDPRAYFRAAQLPLQVFYRSGIRPGPGKDGRTINARVVIFGDDPRPPIEIHLGLGNLSHRARKPWNGQEPSQAEPLGIATDKRWMWHEFGHVLIAASLGELEFRFAHSAGDALAAIVADPHSRLADPTKTPGVNRMRGITFPWVFLTRRHDRCVADGWSWGGTMHEAAARTPNTDGLALKGYRSEQILSTTLFRLYRCLGGDTTRNDQDAPDVDARELASHYSVFLIMKAIQLLGMPPLRAEEFADALMQADVATVNPFQVSGRVGGCAHKLIRWAFEAQGMYGDRNAPGEAEPVDIYIADRRPREEATESGPVTHAAGGYPPVSLDWRRSPARADGAPLWHATEQAIHVQGGEAFVVVNNRGSVRADGVEVRLWRRRRPGRPETLQWDAGTGWTEANAQAVRVRNVPAGGSMRFGPFTGLPTGRGNYLVLAQATCADDRANSDPASNLPCSRQPTPLTDLVAGDNNLGLRALRIA